MSTVNSKDVARLANVSQSTVSLVFSGRYHGRVSDKTREKFSALQKNLVIIPILMRKFYAVGILRLSPLLSQIFSNLILQKLFTQQKFSQPNLVIL